MRCMQVLLLLLGTLLADLAAAGAHQQAAALAAKISGEKKNRLYQWALELKNSSTE